MVLISNFRKFLCQKFLGRAYFGYLSENESTEPVVVSWKCNRPSDKRYPRHVQYIENAVITVARKLGREVAIIRYVGTSSLPPSLHCGRFDRLDWAGRGANWLLKFNQSRKEPHRTTRVNGKWIKYPNHITANFYTCESK